MKFHCKPKAPPSEPETTWGEADGQLPATHADLELTHVAQGCTSCTPGRPEGGVAYGPKTASGAQGASPHGRPGLGAIGGGKGGVGKSLLTANVGITLAQMGHRVCVIDADLGEANLHSCLGVTQPRATLDDVVTRQTEELQELAARGRGTDAAPSDEAPGAPHTTTAPLAEGASPRHGDSPHAIPGTECQANPVISSDQRVDDILAETQQCDGPAIRRLREARGVTVDQINQSTKISLMNLRFIEEDNLDALPAPVYLRGYLQQIAQLLGVDSARVVSGYMARFEPRTGIR